MNEKEALLQQLNDISVPDPVGWWPPAPGWWVLGFIILAALGFGIYFIWQRIQKTRYRKQALRILLKIEKEKDTCSREQTVTRLLALLKRTALTAYKHSRPVVAHLYGHDFIAFLNTTIENPIEIDKKWHNALYQKSLLASEDFPLGNFLLLGRTWIRKHQDLNASELKMRLDAQPLAGLSHG